ncbi:MAG: SDR family oxidoreductase [Acidimicrobiia bacterium]|nr:SDR family oxidoreductase [Acidimicrobiia bacterium]
MSTRDGDPSTVIWVTGASRGLGAAIAKGLAAPGRKIALTARSKEALESVASDVERGDADDVLVLPGSVTDVEEVGSVARRINEKWGGVDALVNNAGVSPVFSKLVDIEVRDWSQILDTNLTGAFLCCREALPYMTAGGSIVNISSVHASSGIPRLTAYAASKGGVEAMTRALAREVASDGVRVNAIAPGYFETDMTVGLLGQDRWRGALLQRIPLGRFGKPEEIVRLVEFLLGKESSYMTGTTLPLDGGWMA